MNYNLEYISPEFRTMMQSALSVDRMVEKELSFREIPNATILPFNNWERSIGGIIDSQHKVISEPNNNQWPVDISLYDLTTIKAIHKTVVYLGFINTCFGHWFTDDLRKVWFLFSKKFMDKDKGDIVFAYTADSESPLTKEQRFFFDLLDINLDNAVFVDTPTQFDKVIIPDDAFCDYSTEGRQYTKEMVDVWNRLINKIRNRPSSLSTPEKVYLSRTRFQSTKEIGEKIIENTFRKQGYTIVYPEMLPLEEQLQIVRNCRSLVATEGSISHMALFCKPQTQLVVLNKARWVNPHQLCVNEYANLNVTYIEVHRSYRVNPSQPWSGPFYMCITPYLQKYIGHYILHLPDSLRPDYWVYSRKIWVRAWRWMLRKFRIKKI